MCESFKTWPNIDVSQCNSMQGASFLATNIDSEQAQFGMHASLSIQVLHRSPNEARKFEGRKLQLRYVRALSWICAI